METIKKGSTGLDVLFLQASLGIKKDGDFGEKTEAAVKQYQASKGLTSDGVVGSGTWKSLISGRAKLTSEDYERAAKSLGVESKVLRAVHMVESPGASFLTSGYPTVLFEAHVFYKYLGKAGKNPDVLQKSHPGIISKVWNKKLYKGGEAEISRVREAWSISPSISLMSASWGAFQVCGFNFKSCGCSDVFEFMGKMWAGEKEQLDLFCSFLKSSGIIPYMKTKDWAKIAEKYNGKGYRENNYDQKLKSAYLKL